MNMDLIILKDNMVIHKEERVQRELNYAIVDEVDQY